jgi:Probable zinc-ribbon domain
MKSGKQRRSEIKAARAKRQAKKIAWPKPSEHHLRPALGPPVNEELLAPNNSYGDPDFVRRGYYVDRPFRCIDCGKQEVWTGSQQKWWYEVAKGFVYSTAVRCRPCRRKKREHSAESRRIHLEGIQRKNQRRTKSGTEKSS